MNRTMISTAIKGLILTIFIFSHMSFSGTLDPVTALKMGRSSADQGDKSRYGFAGMADETTDDGTGKVRGKVKKDSPPVPEPETGKVFPKPAVSETFSQSSLPKTGRLLPNSADLYGKNSREPKVPIKIGAFWQPENGTSGLFRVKAVKGRSLFWSYIDIGIT